MALRHNKTSAIADDGDATIIQPSNWNDDHIIDETVPAAPASGMRLFARNVAERRLIGAIGPSGLDMVLQPHLGRNKVGRWSPIGNSATLPLAEGLVAPTTTGAAAVRSVATTNFTTRLRRLGYVSTATVATVGGWHAGVAQFTIGTAGSSPLGGFFTVMRFVVSDAAAVAGARMFVGMSSAVAAPTNVEPTTLLNSFGVAKLSGSNNLQIVYGGSAAQTAIDLGVNFPGHTLSADTYELALFANPSLTDTVYYRVERLNTGNVASGTLTAATSGTQLPLSTTLLAPRGWRTNNATALAVGIDMVGVYIETDN